MFFVVFFYHILVCLVDYLSTIYCRRPYGCIFIFEFSFFCLQREMYWQHFVKSIKIFWGCDNFSRFLEVLTFQEPYHKNAQTRWINLHYWGITAMECVKLAFMQSDSLQLRFLTWDKPVKLLEVIHIFRSNSNWNTNRTPLTVKHTVCYCPTWKDSFIFIFVKRLTVRGDTRT